MYVFYANNPNGNLRAEDCVIRAICKVTGEDWYTVYAALTVEGYEIRQQDGGGVIFCRLFISRR